MSATCLPFFGKLHLSKSATLENFDGLRKTLEADLQGPENAGGGLEDAVDAVGHMEPMGPVVVGHRTVVLLHCDEKPHL